MDSDPIILSNHFCTYFINFPPFPTFLCTSSILIHSVVFIHVDDAGDTIAHEVAVDMLLVMVVVVVVAVVVVWC